MIRRMRRTRGSPSRLAGGTAGFTLIELMAAMVILAIGVVSIIQLEVVVVRGNAYARQRVEAYELARGVADELRTWGLEWTDNPLRTFASVFNGQRSIVLTATVPMIGGSYALEDLRAVQLYNGQSIAVGEGFAQAFLINVRGVSPSTSPGLPSFGAIFRVHYIAYNDYNDQGLADDTTARIKIFVSWDSKDFGAQDVGWNAGLDSATFWQRHMIVFELVLTRITNGTV